MGRTVPNLFADSVGQYTLLLPITLVMGALIFAMLGATSAGAVVVFSILYGAFSGACECACGLLNAAGAHGSPGRHLAVPARARGDGERRGRGRVRALPCLCFTPAHPRGRLRIGMGYCISAFALLTGTPIDGALLGRDNVWYKPIVFSGVVILAGCATQVVARALFARRKGTWRV